jgi:hypothetical protein
MQSRDTRGRDWDKRFSEYQLCQLRRETAVQAPMPENAASLAAG